MTTETPQQDGAGVDTASETLTITDNRTGQAVRGPDRGRDDPRDRAAEDQDRTTTTSGS